MFSRSKIVFLFLLFSYNFRIFISDCANYDVIFLVDNSFFNTGSFPTFRQFLTSLSTNQLFSPARLGIVEFADGTASPLTLIQQVTAGNAGSSIQNIGRTISAISGRQVDAGLNAVIQQLNSAGNNPNTPNTVIYLTAGFPFPNFNGPPITTAATTIKSTYGAVSQL